MRVDLPLVAAMKAAIMLALGGALVAAPVPTYAHLRLRALGSPNRFARPRLTPAGWLAVPLLRRPWRTSVVAGGVAAALAVLATLASGLSRAVVAPAIAGSIAGALGGWLASSAAAAKRERRLLDSLTSRVAAVATEIRAGQTEAAALHAASAGAEPELAGLLTAAGEAAAAGGDVASRLHGETEACDLPSSVRSGVRRVAAAWATSRDCGAALATVLDHVHDDLNAHRRRTHQVAAELAGPRTTAVLLSLLPIVGILLGSAAGADPARVLLATPFGEVALVVGVALDAVGVLWTAGITHAAGRSP